jgi:sugar O-acyltransferase (sialic acid O-acetyltransferase NeuD family)
MTIEEVQLESIASNAPAQEPLNTVNEAGVVLFGVRSPLVTEYEETCHRSGRVVIAGVSVEGVPRIFDVCVVIDAQDAGARLRGQPFIACAFNPRRRRELVEIANKSGLCLAPALVDPTAIIARSTRIAKGTFVNAGCVIGSVVLIGENVVVNRAASVGHHSMLEDDVSIGPGATLAGNVRVGRGSVVGAGSTVLPDIRIGSDCVVAAGSVVRRDVPDGTFVAGNPAMAKPFDWTRSSLSTAGGE